MPRVTPLAVIRSSHPGPTAAVTVLAAILAAGFSLPLVSAALVVVAVLFNQLSIGLSNDARDAVRDGEVGRLDKPVVSGDITEGALWRLAIMFALLSLLLSAFVHPGVVIAQAIFLLAGWTYNLGLKATVFSVACYAIGFAALPAIVSFGATTPALAPWWVIVIAAGLGIAAHFGNVMPDRADDHLHGVRGLPQRLSVGTSAVILTAMIVSMSGVLVWGAGSGALSLSVPFAAVATGVAIAGGIIALRDPRSRAPFRAAIAASVILALGLSTVVLFSG